MEFVVELILDILSEGIDAIVKNKNISKWIRYPLMFIVVLFYAVITIGFIVLGASVAKDRLLGGIIIMLIGLIILLLGIFAIIKAHKN